MIMACLIGFPFLPWVTRKLTAKLMLDFLLFPNLIFVSYLLSIAIAFSFIVSIFYVNYFIYPPLFYQSILSPTMCSSFAGSHTLIMVMIMIPIVMILVMIKGAHIY